MRRRPRAARGFTITELVVVMVVIGIMAAVALPRWRGTTGFEERGFRDEVASALRYAQKAAVAARRRVCVNFFDTTDPAPELSATMDSAFQANDCAAPLLGPNGGRLGVQARGTAAFSTVPGQLIFDPLGRPDRRLEIGFADLDSLPIVVEAETGHVH